MPVTNILSKISKYGSEHKTLYLLSVMLFFWAIFDGSFGYIVPIAITEGGYSKTLMGIILGTSSVSGAILDIFLSRFLRNVHYRRLYLFMYGLCFLCPLLLFKGSPIWFFLVGMSFWGFYYDLYGFANLDFVSRKTDPGEHSDSFGVIWVFRALGYTTAPLIIGFLVGEVLNATPYVFMWGMLCISFLLFLLFLYISKKKTLEFVRETPVKRKRLIPEYVVWTKVERVLLPVVILGGCFWVFDSFFWTIGPLMSDTLKLPSTLGGLFLTFYTLPPVLLGFLVGSLTRVFGKKRTAQLSFLFSCLFLCSFFFIQNTYLILLVVLCCSVSAAFLLPSLNGAYSDYITETPDVEKEIESIQDFFTNIGYIFGPILAGFLADKIGNMHSFAYLGLVGVIVSLVLIATTPKSITVPGIKTMTHSL